MSNEYRFLLETDVDFDPEGSVSWVDSTQTPAEQAEARQHELDYVADFTNGTLEAFGLILQRKTVQCEHCGRDYSGEWEAVASLWGIDVNIREQWDAGVFPLEEGEPISVETAIAWPTYLGEVARDLLAEVEG